jgi:hypothetical protein
VAWLEARYRITEQTSLQLLIGLDKIVARRNPALQRTQRFITEGFAKSNPTRCGVRLFTDGCARNKINRILRVDTVHSFVHPPTYMNLRFL